MPIYDDDMSDKFVSARGMCPPDKLLTEHYPAIALAVKRAREYVEQRPELLAWIKETDDELKAQLAREEARARGKTVPPLPLITQRYPKVAEAVRSAREYIQARPELHKIALELEGRINRSVRPHYSRAYTPGDS